MQAKLMFTILAAGLMAVPAQAAPATADQPDPMKKICKKEPPPIGSRLGATRICGTAAEWEARERASNDMGDHIARHQRQRAFQENAIGLPRCTGQRC
jgi:hypothetical protein